MVRARHKPGAFRRQRTPEARRDTTKPGHAGVPDRDADMRARIAIALAAIAVFARALPYPLQISWDDGRFIAHNTDVLKPSAAALARMFSQEQFEAYHPLHLLSYWLDVPWFGPNPWVMHGVNLGLWVIALQFVYAALRALALPAGHAAIACLALGLHPVQTEAVSWATGRKDVLALLLAAASLWLHLRAQTGWDRRAFGSRVLYALALLAKTTCLPLPLLMLLIDVQLRRLRLRDALLRQLPNLAIAAAASFGVMAIWQQHAMVRTSVGGPELAALRFVQTLGHHLLTAIWPSENAPMYATQKVAELEPFATCAFVAWLLAALVATLRGARMIGCGLFGFGLLMLPVSNLVPMYFPLQDRYLSLPLLGLAIAFAGGLSLATSRGERSAPLMASALVLWLGLRTIQYSGEWQSELRLWGHAASTQPDADYAWLKLGEVRREAGELEGAIAAYQGAIHAAPLRKLAHAALFDAVARRDERLHGIAPSRARELAQLYYEQLDSSTALRELASHLLATGYLRALELPMQIVLSREPVPDDALERIAQAQLRDGRPSLARFYVAAMRRAPQTEALRGLLQAPTLRVLP